MNYIQYVLKVLMGLVILMVVSIIYRGVANYVGEQIGFSNFFKYIWQKIKRK